MMLRIGAMFDAGSVGLNPGLGIGSGVASSSSTSLMGGIVVVALGSRVVDVVVVDAQQVVAAHAADGGW